ncbi:CrcB family protein [Nocardioides lentus]|uniref:Fluoride-specific ion channel FluC n=1 Tax=Nocardioides lentus TaxID=338077 RepID=A0ABN2P955_9ACTN
MTPLLVALGAAVGAPARFLLGRRLDGRLPWGILVANVLGSALLGVLTALSLSGAWLALLGTGFCGAFTTYSSLAVGAHDAGPRRGTAYVLLTLGLALPACALGFVAAAAWGPQA